MRTPSMTVAECEAVLGSRGHLFVKSDNRLVARKWLVAQGLPSAFVATLRAWDLARAYNDVTGAKLEELRQRAAAVPASSSSADDDADLEGPDADESEDSMPPVPAVVASNGSNGHAAPSGDALAKIRDLLLGDYRPKVDIDASTVEALIAERFDALNASLPDLIAKHTPVTRLEVKTEHKTLDLGTAPRHRLVPDLIAAVGANIPVALIGPAGAGKTTACEQAAAALELPFYMNGAVSGAHEYLGFKDAHGAYHTTPFRQAFEHGGLYCADEIDAGDPAAILVINSALANGHMPFPDQAEPVAKHPTFRMVACANTFMIGADRLYVGRNQLDAATIDRFAVITWEYDERLERELCANTDWCARVQAIRAAAVAEKGARIIISPRASIYGARLIDSGMSTRRVEEMLIWKGVDIDLRRRIEGRL